MNYAIEFSCSAIYFTDTLYLAIYSLTGFDQASRPQIETQMHPM